MASWRGRRVLVTGGAGFLGSNLCHALGTLGAEVTALDAMLPEMGAHPANLEGSGARLVVGDMRTAELAPLCEGVEAVFNFAAQTSHAGSMTDPFADLSINAMIQLRLIGAVRAAAPDAVVVHASTRQFYGRPQYLPVDERHPIVPPDANGVSKFAGEQYWLLEHRVHGRQVCALRLTNCFGPRLRIRDARQTFLGLWLRRVLEGQPFEVWGGEQLRDLAYSDDVVAGFVAAAEALLAGRRPPAAAFSLDGPPSDVVARGMDPDPGEPTAESLAEAQQLLSAADADVLVGDVVAAEAPPAPAPAPAPEAPRPTGDVAGRAFNLGGAAPVTLRALADLLVARNGGGTYGVRDFPAERAAIDIGSFHADDAAFRAATGWAPRVLLPDGLGRTLDWFRPRLAERLRGPAP